MPRVEIEKIEEIDVQVTYEAGSGSIGIPILAELFKALFYYPPRKLEKRIIVVAGRRFALDSEFYDSVQVGSEVRIHYDDDGNEILKMEIQHNGNWVEI